MSDQPRNIAESMANTLAYIMDAPVTWFREKIVVPNRPKYYYYHKKYRRVPTIDECEFQEPTCMFEANEQFKRDKNVDGEILQILRNRKRDCFIYEGPDKSERCQKICEDYKEAELNYFIKYGDLGGFASAQSAYMKQKHRMVWERRQAEKENSNAI